MVDFAKMVFFFKQKTAYEIRLSLVGSEMCIRDSGTPTLRVRPRETNRVCGIPNSMCS